MIETKQLIIKPYKILWNHKFPLFLWAIAFSIVDLLADYLINIMYKQEYLWLMPNNKTEIEIVILSIVKVFLLGLFIVRWAEIISPKIRQRNFKYHFKIWLFLWVWLIWHYISFLALYYIYNCEFNVYTIPIIISGLILPFIWVRYYSMFAVLLDNQKIESLKRFLYLTKKQTPKICIALLFIIIPCSLSVVAFETFYQGNIIIAELGLNLILLVFTSLWISHCYCQKDMLILDSSVDNA